MEGRPKLRIEHAKWRTWLIRFSRASQFTAIAGRADGSSHDLMLLVLVHEERLSKVFQAGVIQRGDCVRFDASSAMGMIHGLQKRPERAV